MGATKTGQFFSGSFFGILLWATGILMSGFLPTFGDGIEFGYVSALPIVFPAVMWFSCVFTGIKTAKNGKSVFFSSYTAVLLIPILALIFSVILSSLENSTGIESFDTLAAASGILSVPFMGAVVYGADIAFAVLDVNNRSLDFFYILYMIIAATAPIGGIVAASIKKNRQKATVNKQLTA